jgi:hypothetical protein
MRWSDWKEERVCEGSALSGTPAAEQRILSFREDRQKEAWNE